ncbi:MAG TPA: hypothetical protein VJA21_13755 [Verrucomicrobiae bacterium]
MSNKYFMCSRIEHQFDTIRKQEFAISEGPNRKSAKESLRSTVLREYQASDDTLETIGGRHGVPISTITCWAKKNEIPLRGRGRNLQKEPSYQNQQILFSLPGQTYDEVGRKFGITKSRVAGIVKRWRDWAKESHLPFPQPPRKKSAPTPRPVVLREPRSVVLSFRLTAAQASRLKDSTMNTASRESSLNALARSILLNAINSSDRMSSIN